MQEIITPIIAENSTGGFPNGGLPDGYRIVGIPEGMTSTDEMRLHTDFLNNLGRKVILLEKNIQDYKAEIDKQKEDLEKQSVKNIEIIGLFSSVLALLIIDVNIVRDTSNFLNAILLISALTATLLIFASFLHILFSSETKNSLRNSGFWWGLGVLFLLIILGIVASVSGWKILNNDPKVNELNQSTTEQSSQTST